MNIDTINEFVFSKHNIVPGTQLNSIEDVARNHLGLHAARIGSPYTTLCSRLLQYETKMLTNKLYEEKTLIKLRCMRTTLHIAPYDIAPILFNATKDVRLSECLTFFKRNNISLNRVDELESEIISIITEKGLHAKAIEEWIIAKTEKIIEPEIKKIFAKKVLKYYWEKGVLSYFNAASNWEKEDRKYVITKSFYPNLNLDIYQVEDAKELLIIENIKKFGPVTLKDISWWSGLGLNIIKSTIEKNSTKICKFKVNGFENDFYISNEDFHELKNYNVKDIEWISFLAFEDPSLKGYHDSRLRYVDEMNLKHLLNQIGEVQASVIHNGKVIGTWIWDKKKKKMEINYFIHQDTSLIKKINQEKEKYEQILYSTTQNTLFSESEFLL